MATLYSTDIETDIVEIIVSDDSSNIVVDIVPTVTEIDINTAGFGNIPATSVTFTPYKHLTSDNVSDALQELADDFFKQSTEPTIGVDEGDLWHDTANEELKSYREVAPGVYEWVHLLYTSSGDADILDGGAF